MLRAAFETPSEQSKICPQPESCSWRREASTGWFNLEHDFRHGFGLVPWLTYILVSVFKMMSMVDKRMQHSQQRKAEHFEGENFVRTRRKVHGDVVH